MFTTNVTSLSQSSHTQEIYNIIKSVNNENMNISSMMIKDWYRFIMSSLLYEPETETLVPCRVEIRNPLNDWVKCWTLARLKGLSSVSSSYLWQLLHQLLPALRSKIMLIYNVNAPTKCEQLYMPVLRHWCHRHTLTCPSHMSLLQ